MQQSYIKSFLIHRDVSYHLQRIRILLFQVPQNSEERKDEERERRIRKTERSGSRGIP